MWVGRGRCRGRGGVCRERDVIGDTFHIIYFWAQLPPAVCTEQNTARTVRPTGHNNLDTRKKS